MSVVTIVAVAAVADSMADSNHNTDMVGSRNSDTDSSIHTGNIHNSPDIRSLFRPIYQRQNVAPERKLLALPPIRLREVFSSSCFSSLID